jgi:hypothetical protein
MLKSWYRNRQMTECIHNRLHRHPGIDEELGMGEMLKFRNLIFELTMQPNPTTQNRAGTIGCTVVQDRVDGGLLYLGVLDKTQDIIGAERQNGLTIACCGIFDIDRIALFVVTDILIWFETTF